MTQTVNIPITKDLYIQVEQVATMSSGKPVYRLGWDSMKTFFEGIRYEPHKGQKEFHKSLSRVRVLCTGARWGKSFSAGNECAANLIIPNQRWWIVGETYNDAEKEFRYVHDALYEHPDPKLRKYIRGQIISIARNAKQGQMWIKFRNGSSVECKSAERPSNLLGEELNGCIFAEGSQLKRFVYTKYILQRLASRIGQLLIPTTPAGYDDLLFPLWQLGQNPFERYPKKEYHDSYESWQFRSVDNPYYDKKEYALKELMVKSGQLTQAEFDEQWGGLFTSHSGRIYPLFDDRIHVIDPFEVPTTWPSYRTMDIGMDAPTVCLWAHIDPIQTLVITNEYYEEGADVEYHASRITEITDIRHPRYTTIDPSAAQRTAANKESVLLQYRLAGMTGLIPGRNAVQPGIQAVTERLRYTKTETGEVMTAPRLLIFRSCERLIKEFRGYVWSRKKDGERINRPIKRNDHGLDALRYLCMQKPYHDDPMQEENVNPDSFLGMERDRMKDASKLPELGIYSAS